MTISIVHAGEAHLLYEAKLHLTTKFTYAIDPIVVKMKVHLPSTYLNCRQYCYCSSSVHSYTSFAGSGLSIFIRLQQRTQQACHIQPFSTSSSCVRWPPQPPTASYHSSSPRWTRTTQTSTSTPPHPASTVMAHEACSPARQQQCGPVRLPPAP